MAIVLVQSFKWLIFTYQMLNFYITIHFYIFSSKKNTKYKYIVYVCDEINKTYNQIN